MPKKLKHAFKATIMSVIVACFFALILFLIVYMVLGNKIDNTISLINLVSPIKADRISKPIEFENNKIANYPEFGTSYARLKIESIGVNLPVYFGDSLEILTKGVGHDSGSYFPAEGGSIIYMAHNAKKMFRDFSKLELEDEIEVETDYGKFIYKIYDMKIVKETDLAALPIQKEKEILMVYTCYPFNNIGYTTERYVVYAERIS